MRPGSTADKRLAEGIAETVAGTNAHMKRSRVSVIIDGIPWVVRDRDPNQPTDGEIDAQQAQAEKRNEDKIKTALSYYGEVIAVVHAKVDTISSQTSETTYTKLQSKPQKETSETNSTSTPQVSSSEPGAQPNTSLAIPSSASNAPASTTELEKTTTDSQIFPDQKVEQRNKPPGEATVTSATVSVPRSYIINILKSTNSSASSKDPDPADIDKMFAQLQPTIVKKVVDAVGLADEKTVSVDMYFDAPLMMASGASSSASASNASAVTVSLGGHVKEIAVGVLALVSLFMVSMMVKKTAPAPIVAAAAVESNEPVMLGRNIDIAGEVSEGGQALDGMELDDDAVKAQQMVDQVSTMVKENPDGAANMVKRWLNRS